MILYLFYYKINITSFVIQKLLNVYVCLCMIYTVRQLLRTRYFFKLICNVHVTKYAKTIESNLLTLTVMSA